MTTSIPSYGAAALQCTAVGFSAYAVTALVSLASKSAVTAVVGSVAKAVFSIVSVPFNLITQVVGIGPVGNWTVTNSVAKAIFTFFNTREYSNIPATQLVLVALSALAMVSLCLKAANYLDKQSKIHNSVLGVVGDIMGLGSRSLLSYIPFFQSRAASGSNQDW